MKTPVAFITYKRPETTRRVFEAIRKASPKKLYLIADGPKEPHLAEVCSEVRSIVENGIDWECELIKLYSENNLGLARRVQTGLDEVFAKEDRAIILEDDTLPNPTFFTYCEELLERYVDDKRVFHLSGCNPHPVAFTTEASYCFSSIVNVWGWASWARAWRHFDLRMESWTSTDQQSLLQKWCPNHRERKGARSMFDLHCRNDDPWAWSYQWIYACWSQDALSAIPDRNLVSNLGIGPEGSNTQTKISVPLFPERLESIVTPLSHPPVQRDRQFEKRYHKLETPSPSRRLKNWLKSYFPPLART